MLSKLPTTSADGKSKAAGSTAAVPHPPKETPVPGDLQQGPAARHAARNHAPTSDQKPQRRLSTPVHGKKGKRPAPAIPPGPALAHFPTSSAPRAPCQADPPRGGKGLTCPPQAAAILERRSLLGDRGAAGPGSCGEGAAVGL